MQDRNDSPPVGNSPLAELDKANLRVAMRLEALGIAASHPDIISDFWDGEKIAPLHQQARPVIITIPADLCSRDLEVLVRHEFDTVFVDVRGERHQAWTPAALAGVDVEVRDR
jgi:hypothetical protein